MGIYFLYCEKNEFLSPIFFSLATGIRSNGIILSGFFIFNFLKKEISLVNFYFFNQTERNYFDRYPNYYNHFTICFLSIFWLFIVLHISKSK
jgi:Gpi18-like mannosyltransferase